ncbi:unnamed protein product [Blepharisma stoltei]|uniref:Cyclic nucleotide-binding domain-containing protein n=1 Tax=Blepharisma stoltei TaxID=1481888 RepID=A0AAU9K6D7_9CILI|nr:unnamed protein product [Blepharisma stoltei]
METNKSLSKTILKGRFISHTRNPQKSQSLTNFNFKAPSKKKSSTLKICDPLKITTPIKLISKIPSVDQPKILEQDLLNFQKKIALPTTYIASLKIKVIDDALEPGLLSPPGFKQKDIKPSTNPGHDRRKALSMNDLVLPSVKTRISEPFPDSHILSLQSLQFIIGEMKKPVRDIEKIYNMTRRLKFFLQYKADIVKQMLRVGEYEFYSKGQIIFREGELGKHLYVILRGSIGVQKESKKPGELAYIINSRYDGEVIGEYAIVRGNVNNAAAQRSATCFAAEACHMIKIAAEDYVFAVSANIDIESKILHFLNGLGPFEHIAPIDLALLANTLNKEYFGLDAVVLGAGMIPKGMYIVYSGRVKITYPFKTPKYSKNSNKITYKNSIKDFYLPRGSYFGQRILLGEYQPAKYSVISDSAQTSVLVITTHEFNLLYNPNKEDTINYLSKSHQFDIDIPNL